MAPSELRRRFTLRDIMELVAYYKLHKEFEGKPPPPPDDEHPLLVAVIENPELYPAAFGPNKWPTTKSE